MEIPNTTHLLPRRAAVTNRNKFAAARAGPEDVKIQPANNDTTTRPTATLHCSTHSCAHPCLLSQSLDPTAIYLLRTCHMSTCLALCNVKILQARIPPTFCPAARAQHDTETRQPGAGIGPSLSVTTAPNGQFPSTEISPPPRVSPGFATLSLGRWLRPSAALGGSRADGA